MPLKKSQYVQLAAEATVDNFSLERSFRTQIFAPLSYRLHLVLCQSFMRDGLVTVVPQAYCLLDTISAKNEKSFLQVTGPVNKNIVLVTFSHTL